MIPRCRRPPASTSRPATRTRSGSSSCRAPRSGSAGASYCEVRLSEPELAEEECRLRRRGGAWQLVPARRDGGSVWVDGQAVEQPCPIPFDVPFRVGDHWLTLRPTSTADPDWASTYRPPPPMELPPSPRASLEDLRAGPPRRTSPDRAGPTAPSPRPRRTTCRAGRRAPSSRRRGRGGPRRSCGRSAGRRPASGSGPRRGAMPPIGPPPSPRPTSRWPHGCRRPPVPRPGLRERSSASFEAPPPPVVPPAAPPPSATVAPPRISPTDATGPVPYEPPRPKRDRPAAPWQEAPLQPRPQPEAWPDPPVTHRISPQPPQARAVPTIPLLSPVGLPAEGDSAAVEADAVVIGPFADEPGPVKGRQGGMHLREPMHRR